MAPPGKITNGEIVEKIIAQAKIWYTSALNSKDKGLFYIGKLVHMCQDSFSTAHTQRNSQNEILNFQYYGNQDSKKHSKAETRSKSNNIKFDNVVGTHRAVDHSKAIIQSYSDQEAWSFVESYLRSNVYVIAKGRKDALAGAAAPQFSCGKEGCGLSKIRLPGRIIRITVKNNTGKNLEYRKTTMSFGCFQCLDSNYQLTSEIQQPCKTIHPGKSCTFELVSCYKAKGLVGSITYGIPHGKTFDLKYANPVVGWAHYGFCSGRHCTDKKIGGKRAHITYSVGSNNVYVSGHKFTPAGERSMKQKVKEFGHKISTRGKKIVAEARRELKKFGEKVKMGMKSKLDKIKKGLKKFKFRF
jgi:hypothetical protein